MIYFERSELQMQKKKNAGNPFNNLFEWKSESEYMGMLLLGCQVYFPFPLEGPQE